MAVSFWQQTSAIESKWCNCYWLAGGWGWSLESFVCWTRFPEMKESNWSQPNLDSARSSEVLLLYWKRVILNKEKNPPQQNKTILVCFFRNMFKEKYWRSERTMRKCSSARQFPSSFPLIKGNKQMLSRNSCWCPRLLVTRSAWGNLDLMFRPPERWGTCMIRHEMYTMEIKLPN